MYWVSAGTDVVLSVLALEAEETSKNSSRATDRARGLHTSAHRQIGQIGHIEQIRQCLRSGARLGSLALFFCPAVQPGQPGQPGQPAEMRALRPSTSAFAPGERA